MIRIVKLGGSLLDLPDLASRWRQWEHAQSPGIHHVIVGGGAWVDAIRRFDAHHHLPDHFTHWLAIDAMQITAKLASIALRIPCVTELVERSGPSTIFETSNWLREREPYHNGPSLPQTWSVTSDSIAARVAQVADADELVLLKSSLPSYNNSHSEPAGLSNEPIGRDFEAVGYVDEYFPRIAPLIRRIRLVDFRHPEFLEQS